MLASVQYPSPLHIRLLKEPGSLSTLETRSKLYHLMRSIGCTVRFDPIKCEPGSTCTVLPFNVSEVKLRSWCRTLLILLYFFLQLVGGPIYQLKLSAKVTRPSMELSSSHLDFGTVLCGQCKSITLRLTNPFAVR